jgi:hypothetical protein
MPLPREVDLMPGGDFAFLAVIPPYMLRLCELWFYDWDQVERGEDDGRTYAPAYKAVLGDREMRMLAKHLLKLVGDPIYKQISVPDQEWNLAGNDIEDV